MTPAPVQPTVLTRMHCPVIDCRHLANARSLEGATEAVEDHIARVHGTVVKPA